MEYTLDETNKEQMRAFELISSTSSSFFLTGKAGTGKTTFLHNVQRMVNKQFVILAPTGVAAILAGGETIHSFFGLPLAVCSPGTIGRLNETRVHALLHADTIIIDEVSMVRCDIVDAIDYTLRNLLRTNFPFGGKQMVFMGDMFQLSPIAKDGAEKEMLKDMYQSESYFFYQAKALERLRLVKIEFTKVYRQEDQKFIGILDNVRRNQVTYENLSLLNSRMSLPSSEEGMVVTLTPYKSTAERINNCCLSRIKSDEYTYEGSVQGTFDEKRFPVEMTLHLKVGAQVMFTRNDSLKRWVNGTIGVVTELTEKDIHVKTDNGNEHSVLCCTWESIAYEYDREEKKLKKEVKGTFTQYPLTLAWAITIHKSQGMTFDKLSLNIDHGLFADGQLYVALSRVRSLDGLYLSREIDSRYIHTNPEILNFSNGFNDVKTVDNEIESGRAVYSAIKQNDYDEAARQYLLLICEKVAYDDIEEAMLLERRFMDTVICDESLFGSIDLPNLDDLKASNKWSYLQLVALLSLYSEEYEQALQYSELALEIQECPDLLFIKSRSLFKLERYSEADEVNRKLTDYYDAKSPDLKVVYMVAILNELYVGDPGLQIMKTLVESKPKYDKGIIAFRMLMKRHNLMLDAIPEHENQLVDAFNSDLSQEEFDTMLKKSRQEAPKTVNTVVGRIRNYYIEDDEKA